MKKSLSFIMIFILMFASLKQTFCQSKQVSIFFSYRNLFLINKITSKKQQRDSVITSIENRWNTIHQLVDKDNYADAVKVLDEIITEIDLYSLCCKKNKKAELVFKDTTKQLLSNYKFLDSLLPQIKLVSMWSDSIPENGDDLVMQNRHQMIAIKNRCKDTINAEIKRNPEKTGAIRFGFHRSIVKLNILDSLFRDIYDQEKSEFSIKCKFYHNRAVESNDTVQLRRFVDDCDYYQTDKEWCTRARMILAGMDTKSLNTQGPAASKSKISDGDVMKIEYQQAMLSRRIDLLEGYLNRYNKRKIKKSESKIDSVRIVLEKVKKEIDAEIAFDKTHPRFANAPLNQLDIYIKGLSQSTQDIFRDVIEKNRDSLKKIPDIRFPAKLQFDFTGPHPLLFFNAFINNKKDVNCSTSDSGTSYSIAGVTHLMNFLDFIKKTTVNSVPEKTAAEKIALAAYVVRLRKNSEEYITFYGKENPHCKNADDKFSFYDFLDISVKDQKDVRFKNPPSNSLMLLKSEDESEKNLLGKMFFEK